MEICSSIKGEGYYEQFGKKVLGSCTGVGAMLSYVFPVLGGVTTVHTGGDLPFVFCNLDRIDYLLAGDQENAWKVCESIASAFAAFAYTGDPSTETLKWDAFTVENGETMIFDVNSEIRNYHDAELMSLLF